VQQNHRIVHRLGDHLFRMRWAVERTYGHDDT
jgi:hypothetical protein